MPAGPRACRRELGAIEAEAARIASLPFADSHEQQRLLLKLRHTAAQCLARFYRDVVEHCVEDTKTLQLTRSKARQEQ